MHKWNRFFESDDRQGQACFYYGCQKDGACGGCGLRELGEWFEREFGKGLLEDAQLIAELSGETEKMDPGWSPVVYEAVRLYRSEQQKFEQLRMKELRDAKR